MWGRCMVGEGFWSICVLAAAAFQYECVSVCLEMAGLELPDVEWATCLSGPKHRNFPLTAEINQSQGNLYSKMRREEVFASVYLREDEYFFIHMFLCVHDYHIPV